MQIGRVAGMVAATMLMLTAVGAQAQRGASPAAPAPASAPASAPALPRGNVEHGRYLVEQVAMCVECHSSRDARGNIIASERYTGAPIPFSPPWPSDWATYAPRNKGLPGYDDAAALRLLTQGSLGRRGEQLRAPMPRFRMTVQDAADVIAFLRSVE